jgi:hypothetical protein
MEGPSSTYVCFRDILIDTSNLKFIMEATGSTCSLQPGMRNATFLRIG